MTRIEISADVPETFRLFGSQVPLMLTVYLLVSFKKFKLWRKTEDEICFTVPSGFRKVTLDEFTSPSFGNSRTPGPDADRELFAGEQIDCSSFGNSRTSCPDADGGLFSDEQIDLFD